jgi:hypothetical protein
VGYGGSRMKLAAMREGNNIMAMKSKYWKLMADGKYDEANALKIEMNKLGFESQTQAQ